MVVEMICEKCKTIKQMDIQKDEVAVCLMCGETLKKVLKEEVPVIEIGGDFHSNMKLLFGD